MKNLVLVCFLGLTIAACDSGEGFEPGTELTINPTEYTLQNGGGACYYDSLPVLIAAVGQDGRSAGVVDLQVTASWTENDGEGSLIQFADGTSSAITELFLDNGQLVGVLDADDTLVSATGTNYDGFTDSAGTQRFILRMLIGCGLGYAGDVTAIAASGSAVDIMSFSVEAPTVTE